MAAGVAGYALMERATAPVAGVAIAAESDVVQRALRLGKPAVVEFGANACASCREMKPVLEALEREHGERITVVNVDILKARSYIARYSIQLMPTQVFFDAQGREIGTVMSPCATPALIAALALAGSGALFGMTMVWGAALLLAYGLGHSVLLLVAGAMPSAASALARRFARFEAWIPGRRAFALVMLVAGLWWIAQGIDQNPL